MAPTEHVDVEPEVLDEAHAQSSNVLKKALRLAGKLPFMRQVVAMVYAFRDPNVPIAKKAIIAGAVLYFLSPMDLIPDFIAGIGYADDAAVVIGAFKAVQDIISEEHYDLADAFLNG